MEIHPNIVIKLPLITEGLRACKRLTDKGVKTNVTLCFSASQALLAAKAGATYISPFIGRLDDISEDGMELIQSIRLIYDNYGYETQILAASIRHPMHVVQSALAGADVATIPHKVIAQLVKHPLTDLGQQKFLADWEKVLSLTPDREANRPARREASVLRLAWNRCSTKRSKAATSSAAGRADRSSSRANALSTRGLGQNSSGPMRRSSETS